MISYLDSIKSTLLPPVSNKLMFDGEQLKVMVVGGPNERKDYHLNMGEELFIQLIGDMNLDILDPSTQEKARILIPEGHIFLLPCCIPHSPQRYAGSIGLVFERTRLRNEIDGLRYYKDDQSIEYETFFHCTDLGTQIKEAIETFNSLKQTNQITNKESSPYRKIIENKSNNSLNITPIIKPQKLSDVLLQLNENEKMTKVMNAKEFKVNCLKGSMSNKYIIDNNNIDVFVWQHGQGSARLTLLSSTSSLLGGMHEGVQNDNIIEVNLGQGDVHLIPRDIKQIRVDKSSEDSCLMFISNSVV